MILMYLLSVLCKFLIIFLLSGTVGGIFLCGYDPEDLLILVPFCGFVWLVSMLFKKASGITSPLVLKTRTRKVLAVLLCIAYSVFLVYSLEYY